MADLIQNLPEAHFGDVSEEEIDWRAEAEGKEEDDDAPASEELIAMLGFDPDKEGKDNGTT